MPKLKTHKGTAKRIKITAGGKLRHRSAFRSHLREKKKASRKRRYQREYDLPKGEAKKVKKLLPYQ